MSTNDASTMTDNSTTNDSKISTTVSKIMIDNLIISFNIIIQRSTDIGFLSKERVNELRDMLCNRDRINTEILNAIIKCNKSFLALYDCLISNASTTSNASATLNASVI